MFYALYSKCGVVKACEPTNIQATISTIHPVSSDEEHLFQQAELVNMIPNERALDKQAIGAIIALIKYNTHNYAAFICR